MGKKAHGTFPARCGEVLELLLADPSLIGHAFGETKHRSLRSKLMITSLGIHPIAMQEIQDAFHIKAKSSLQGLLGPEQKDEKKDKRRG